MKKTHLILILIGAAALLFILAFWLIFSKADESIDQARNQSNSQNSDQWSFQPVSQDDYLILLSQARNTLSSLQQNKQDAALIGVQVMLETIVHIREQLLAQADELKMQYYEEELLRIQLLLEDGNIEAAKERTILTELVQELTSNLSQGYELVE